MRSESYAITYGDAVTTSPVTYSASDLPLVLSAAVAQTGYEFIGWTAEGEETPVLNYEIPVGTQGALSFTAHFAAKTYQVTLDSAAGTCQETTATVTYGAEVELPVPTYDQGYFIGWYLEDREITVWDVDAEVTLTAKYRLYGEDFKIVYNRTLAGYVLDAYTGDKTVVVAPSVWNNRPVLSIGEYCFAAKTDITEVILCEGIRYIDASAFFGCTALTTVQIPSTLVNIGVKAFYSCKSLANISFNEGLVSVGDAAFYDCRSLTALNLPDSLQTIGNNAFESLQSLKTLSIGKATSSIGSRAFSYAPQLESITVSAENTAYASVDNCLMQTSKSILINGCKNSVIPANTTRIQQYAFAGSVGLTSVTIPETVRQIENGAFRNTGLTSIVVPDTVAEIGTYLFAECENLQSAIISQKIAALPERTFNNCSSLTTVNLPSNLTTIGTFAFYRCTALEAIEIPEKVTAIAANAFDSCYSLTQITLPSGITDIREYTFYNCTSLPSITLPQGLISISASAFEDCSSLANVTFPESLTTLTQCAFAGCTSFTKISLPTNRAISIGWATFAECANVTEIIIPEGYVSLADDTRSFFRQSS